LPPGTITGSGAADYVPLFTLNLDVLLVWGVCAQNPSMSIIDSMTTSAPRPE
jgi:hypothetical protein